MRVNSAGYIPHILGNFSGKIARYRKIVNSPTNPIVTHDSKVTRTQHDAKILSTQYTPISTNCGIQVIFRIKSAKKVTL